MIQLVLEIYDKKIGQNNSIVSLLYKIIVFRFFFTRQINSKLYFY